MYKILHIEASESIRMLLADVFNSFYIDVELVSFENWAVAKKQTILGANFELIILDEFLPEEKYAAVHEDICRTSPN
jgi:DNA-binding response OmpR family regulator